MASRTYRAEAIVLKRINVGEADRLVTFFTKEYGKVKAIAKGVRRITSKRAGNLEIFSRVVVSFYKGKTRDYIAEVVGMHGVGEQTDLKRLANIYFLSELIDQFLPEQEEHTYIYHQFVGALDAISTGEQWLERTHVFSQFLLRELGYLAENKELTSEDSVAFIESILERKLKTPKLLLAAYR